MARSSSTGGPAARLPEVMTIDDMVVYPQPSKSSLCKFAQSGRIPDQKVGEHWRFYKGVIDS